MLQKRTTFKIWLVRRNHTQIKEAIIKVGAPIPWSITAWGTGWDCGKSFWWRSKMLSLTGGKCGTLERTTGDGVCTDLLLFHLQLMEWLLSSKSCSFSSKLPHLLNVHFREKAPLFCLEILLEQNQMLRLVVLYMGWRTIEGLSTSWIYTLSLVNWDLILYSFLLASF